MVEQKIIVVLGATGAQGGGLARAILNDPTGGFAVRALTRDPNSAPARALTEAGAAVVAADVDDPASLERAFRGAHGAFCVTFYWAHMSPEKELAEAKAMAEAARRAGLAHVIWSTLEDTRQWVPLDDRRMPTLMGRYKVPHFDAKGESDRFFTAAGLPVTFLRAAFYWDNFIRMGPKPGPDGTLVLTLPMGDKKLAGIAAEDIGKCAYGIFRRGGEFIAKTVGIAGEHLTGAQMAAAFTRALGREVRYQSIAPEVFRTLGFPGAEDLGNMFQFYCDFEEHFRGARDPALARSLNADLQTFAVWLERNKSRIPLD